jgi:hypothetical protein
MLFIEKYISDSPTAIIPILLPSNSSTHQQQFSCLIINLEFLPLMFKYLYNSWYAYDESCGFNTPACIMYAMYLPTGISKSWKFIEIICTTLANSTFTGTGSYIV